MKTHLNGKNVKDRYIWMLTSPLENLTLATIKRDSRVNKTPN